MRQEVLRRSGGLVSAEVSQRGGSRVGRVVAKFPQKPSGMTYEGWLFLNVGERVTASLFVFPSRELRAFEIAGS